MTAADATASNLPNTRLQKLTLWLLLSWGVFIGIRFVLITGLPQDINFFFSLLSSTQVPHKTSFSIHISTLLNYTQGLCLLIGILSGCFAIGYRCMSCSVRSSLLKTVFSVAIGLSILSYTMMVLGFLRLYRGSILWGLWLTLTILGVLSLKDKRQRLHLIESFNELSSSFRNSLSNTTPIIFTVLVVTSFLMAFVPEISYDAQVYHLGVPQQYLAMGRIVPLPLMHSNFPSAIQMIYTLGMALHGDLLPKLLHWLMGFTLGCGLLAFGIDNKKTESGWLSAALFLSMPMTQMNWWTAGIDIGLSLFAFLSMVCLANAIKDPSTRGGWLLRAGVLSGVAAASKYTAFALPFCLCLALGFEKIKSNSPSRRLFQDCALVLASAGLVIFPWLAKNLLFTGNPFYPFFSRWLGAPGLSATGWNHFLSENEGWICHGIFDWLALPWSLTFHNAHSLSYPGPLLLDLAPLSIYGLWVKPRPIWWSSMSAVVIALILSTVSFNRLLRYSLPGLTGICVLLAWGVQGIVDAAEKIWRRSFLGILLGLFIVNLTAADLVIGIMYRPAAVLAGNESRLEYASYSHPGGLNPYPSTALFNYFEDRCPPGGRLMLVGDEKIARCRFPLIFSGVFNETPLIVWSNESKTAEEIRQRFQKAGVTHIAINPKEAQRLYGYGILNWDEKSLARFCLFWEKWVMCSGEIDVPEKMFPPGILRLFLFETLINEKELSEKNRNLVNPLLWLEENRIAKEQGLQGVIDFYKRLQLLQPGAEIFRLRLKQLKNTSTEGS